MVFLLNKRIASFSFCCKETQKLLDYYYFNSSLLSSFNASYPPSFSFFLLCCCQRFLIFQYPVFFLLNKKKYYRIIVDLQCCLNFLLYRKVIQFYIYIFFLFFYYGLIITGHWTWFPILYSKTLLFIHLTYDSLQLLIPNSQSFPTCHTHTWQPQVCSLHLGVFVLQICSFVSYCSFHM